MPTDVACQIHLRLQWVAKPVYGV